MDHRTTDAYAAPARGKRGSLPLAFVFGIATPLLGTLLVETLFPAWSLTSLPVHSVVEVLGAGFGLVLALIILYPRMTELTSHGLCVACALISMSVLDTAHSCVSPGGSFVWLHSLAVLAGGVFFAFLWIPERHVNRQSAHWLAGAVCLASIMLSIFSGRDSEALPLMIVEGRFTPMADAINLTGGGLTLLGALSFAVRYHKSRSRQDLTFVLLCLLFGSAGGIFHLSDIWHGGWWLWHALRLGGYLLACWLALFADREVETRVAKMRADQADAIAGGDFTVDITPMNERDRLGKALGTVAAALKEEHEQRLHQDWLETGISWLNDAMRGNPSVTELSRKVISELTTYLGAQAGLFYVSGFESPVEAGTHGDRTAVLTITGSYARSANHKVGKQFRLGEGLPGQAAAQKQPICLTDVPEDYMPIHSALGDTAPRNVLVYPLIYDDKVRGAIELGSLHAFGDRELEYLEQAGERVAIAIRAAQSNEQTRALLQSSQTMMEELHSQQEDVRGETAR